MPTLIALDDDGVEVGRLVGAQTSDAVRSLFAAATGDGTTVRAGAPRSLVAIRAAAGLSLAVGGLTGLIVYDRTSGGWLGEAVVGLWKAEQTATLQVTPAAEPVAAQRADAEPSPPVNLADPAAVSMTV